MNTPTLIFSFLVFLLLGYLLGVVATMTPRAEEAGVDPCGDHPPSHIDGSPVVEHDLLLTVDGYLYHWDDHYGYTPSGSKCYRPGPRLEKLTTKIK